MGAAGLPAHAVHLDGFARPGKQRSRRPRAARHEDRQFLVDRHAALHDNVEAALRGLGEDFPAAFWSSTIQDAASRGSRRAPL